MKITTKLMMLGLVGLAAAPFILKKPDGTPWLKLSDLMKQTDGAVQEVQKSMPTMKQPTQMYKWQDKAGKWHFSDRPSEDFNSEQVKIDAAYNQMKHIDLPEGFGDSKRRSDKSDEEQEGAAVPSTTAPLEKVPELLQDIEKFQDKMDERQKLLDSL